MVRDDSSESSRVSSRRRVLRATAGLAATGLAGCGQIRSAIGNGTGGLGGGGGTPTVDPGPDVTTLTPADCEPETVSGAVEADTTWDASECPRVAIDGNVVVSNDATLTIEAGVEVLGLPGARLTVRDGSTLVVSGESENPVWFHGESDTSGYWEGIRVRSATGNELHNVVVANAGKNGWANVWVDEGAQLSVTNVRSAASATSGLVAGSGATLPEFAANEFRENDAAALYVPTTLVGSVDEGSSYTGGNDTDAVRVFSDEVVDDTTWAAAPYFFEGGNHPIGDGAVTVEPGAEFTFGSGARLTVRSGSSLAAEGTSDSPVTFEGEADTSGYWEGIRVRSNDPGNSLDNVVVAHAGKNGWANVWVDEGAQLSVTNSALRQSATSGLIAGSGARLSEFAANEFRENDAAALYVPTTLAGAVDAASTYAADNGTDAVRVFADEVVDDATWTAAPYFFEGGNHPVGGGAVTVESGAEFTFGSDSRLTVRSGSSFTVEGSGDSPVTFEGATASPGHWEGIRVRSNDPGNSLSDVVVAHAGKNGWANVWVDEGAQLSVTNSALRQSATWGLYAADGATLDASNNTYENNGEGGVRTPQSG
jgi:hypothetical protein